MHNKEVNSHFVLSLLVALPHTTIVMVFSITIYLLMLCYILMSLLVYVRKRLALSSVCNTASYITQFLSLTIWLIHLVTICLHGVNHVVKLNG